MKTDLKSKPHYPVLDGLRGVAALLVVAFHLLEPHAANYYKLMINHGYLAVDFFFLLSGYVIAYAYDDRWGKMSTWDFFKRRLVRLQPMVVMGALLGGATFYFLNSPMFPGIHAVPVLKMLFITLLGILMIPVPASMDIRGWHEMYPINGPAWSLFFEYIGNILYALFVRRFSKTVLAILVAAAGAALIQLTVERGNAIGGWVLTPDQFRFGFTRLAFPFFAGILLFRVTKPGRVNNAFLWCSLLLALMFSLPNIGGAEYRWANGLYDSLTIILVFPLIVWLGASSGKESPVMQRICKFLGDISYPIYITHYSVIYFYWMWVGNGHTLAESWPLAVGLFFLSILLAWLCLKLYDIPVRKWLKAKLKA